ncbi:hypothetical protein IZU27_02690 [Treponema socranskii]|uniref:hypothetical protein n=1 Tax=Treponema socranskii TaxID=53419 RepID=UPI003D911EE1
MGASLYDAFRAVGGFTSEMLQIQDIANRELAEANLKAQQIDLNAWQQQELQKFAGRSDWENFQKEWDDDFAKKYEEYNSASGPNAYQNDFTARYGNELFASMKASGDMHMSTVIQNGKRIHAGVMLDEAYDKAGKGTAGQERLDMQSSIIDQKYRSGLYANEADYRAAKAKLYNDTAAEMYADLCTRLAGENKELDENQITELARKEGIKLNISAASHAGDDVAVYADSALAEKTGIKIYERHVQEHQDTVNEQETQRNTAIIDNFYFGRKNAGELIDDANLQIQRLEAMSPQDISAQQRRARIKEIMSYKDQIKNGTGSSGSAGMTKAESAIKKKFEHLIAAARAGNTSDMPGVRSAYDLVDWWAKDGFDQLADEYGIDGTDRTELKTWSRVYLLDELFKAYKNEDVGKIAPALKDLKSYIANLKDYKDLTPDERNALQEKALRIGVEKLLGLDVSLVDPAAFAREVGNTIASGVFEASKLNTTTKKGDAKVKESTFTKAVKDLDKNAESYITLNAMGQIVTPPNVNVNLDEYKKIAAEKIAVAAGLKTDDLTADWKRDTDGRTITGIMYTDGNGNRYELKYSQRGGIPEGLPFGGALKKDSWTVYKNGEALGEKKQIEKKQRQEQQTQKRKTQAKERAERHEAWKEKGRAAHQTSVYRDELNRYDPPLSDGYIPPDAEHRKRNEEFKRIAETQTMKSPIQSITDEQWQKMSVKKRIKAQQQEAAMQYVIENYR